MTAQVFEYTFEGSHASLKDEVIHELERRGFQIAWTFDWFATAERRSKLHLSFFDTVARHLVLAVTVRTVGGNSVLRLERRSPLLSLNTIGEWRSARSFVVLGGALASVFAASDDLVGVTSL